jgi:hypothetical protein
MAFVSRNLVVQAAQRIALAFQHLQEAAIDIEQQPGDAERRIVGARGLQDVAQFAVRELAARGTHIKKLVHARTL